jgi:hypothetical protein
MNVDELLKPANHNRSEDLIKSGNDANVFTLDLFIELSGIHIGNPNGKGPEPFPYLAQFIQAADPSLEAASQVSW